jgi:hypothetical protein
MNNVSNNNIIILNYYNDIESYPSRENILTTDISTVFLCGVNLGYVLNVISLNTNKRNILLLALTKNLNYYYFLIIY